nr:unnamed protein product [Callosobruchus chinensis]
MGPQRAASTSLVLCVVLFCLDCALGHVALVYPPARKYDLDFLDNSRTKPPCGMPRGRFRDRIYDKEHNTG